MIHHLSIAAHQPEHVAKVLAELFGGRSYRFSPVRGSYVAFAGDEHGTAIEVYPIGTELAPRPHADAVQAVRNPIPSSFTATHAAISVALTEAQIMAIAARENWHAIAGDRGGLFRVIEFWVENRLMLELLTAEMARDYCRAMTPERWTEFLGEHPYSGPRDESA